MRFHPLILKVRELVQSGKLGEVRLLTADFGYPTSFDPESRFFNPALGGGALLDRGVYPLSLAYFLLGNPAEVVGQATIGTTGVDEQQTALLSYPSGALAVLAASLRSRLRNEAVVIGTEGRIRNPRAVLRPQPHHLDPDARAGRSRPFGFDWIGRMESADRATTRCSVAPSIKSDVRCSGRSPAMGRRSPSTSPVGDTSSRPPKPCAGSAPANWKAR